MPTMRQSSRAFASSPLRQLAARSEGLHRARRPAAAQSLDQDERDEHQQARFRRRRRRSGRTASPSTSPRHGGPRPATCRAGHYLRKRMKRCCPASRSLFSGHFQALAVDSPHGRLAHPPRDAPQARRSRRRGPGNRVVEVRRRPGRRRLRQREMRARSRADRGAVLHREREGPPQHHRRAGAASPLYAPGHGRRRVDVQADQGRRGRHLACDAGGVYSGFGRAPPAKRSCAGCSGRT